jgi:hypothetical protein
MEGETSGHAERMEEMRNAFEILTGKPGRKRDNSGIIINLKELIWGIVGCIHMNWGTN